MVQVIVKLATFPHQATEVIRALRSLQMAIQSVQGLICSHIYTDAEAPDSLLYVEEWKAPEHLSQEAVVTHFKRLFALMERSPKAPVLRVATVGDPCGIEHLSTLMRSRSAAASRDSPDAMHRAPTDHSPDGDSP